MPPEESTYPGHWLAIAEKDLIRVDRLLDVGDPEGAGFHLQQAVEKYLKAFLLSQGWQLRRIHSLDALLDDTLHHDSLLEDYRAVCQKITAYYFLERYPVALDVSLTVEEVRTSKDQAGPLIERLVAATKSPSR